MAKLLPSHNLYSKEFDMNHVSRREFIATSALGVTAMAATKGFADQSSPSHGTKFKTRLFKSTIGGIPNEKSLTKLKEAGFDGIECNNAGADPAAAEAAGEPE